MNKPILKEYLIKTSESRNFTLLEDNHELGHLLYPNWFSFKAEIILSDSSTYQIGPVGFWGTTIELKKDDVITKVGDKKIENPDDLTAAIKDHKPGDKVAISYLRDKKEMKATAELTKWKGVRGFATTIPGQNFNMNLEGMDFERIIPRLEGLRGTAPFGGQNWNWSGSSPKLGLSVQDTDDGKGVKVIEVDEESNAAKAGVKEEDIITHIDDKAVNNVDEISKLLREKKENPTVRFQLTRSGKSQNIEVKMPRKIKTADL